MDLPQKIEAILFWKAEPVAIKKLASLLNESTDTIRQGIEQLEQGLKGRGITLVQTDDDIMLGTAKELSPLIEQLTKDELTHDLGKAGLETLSIVLYQGPISRANIDYIRGVNSQFILRSLLIRGLVERIDNPEDARSFLYKPTLDLLSHLGITKISDLPEYYEVKNEIQNFKCPPVIT
ncbi:MAG: SMC-Scp complex subunit ScpB [Candidatus Taylorbacteria bacterium]|nr:SMC-Scp complex subunit ScpB [Candidatus Taylorbacteria bacterium]